MKTLKISTITLFSIILFSFNKHQNYTRSSITDSSKDSILLYKTELLSIIPFKEKDTLIIVDSDSKGTYFLSYHLINFDKKYIQHFTFDNDKKSWKSIKFPFEKYKKINLERTDFTCLSEEGTQYIISYIENEKGISFVYSITLNKIIYYPKAIKVDIDILNELNNLNEQQTDLEEPIEQTKEIVIKEHIKNFEYSEHWKTESYKKVVEFMKQRISKDNCKMVSRGYYNTNLVQYIGNQGYKVKIYCEFDCNQNYINQSYFWVEAFYLGFGKWDLELIDQKLTH